MLLACDVGLPASWPVIDRLCLGAASDGTCISFRIETMVEALRFGTAFGSAARKASSLEGICSGALGVGGPLKPAPSPRLPSSVSFYAAMVAYCSSGRSGAI